MAEIHHPTRCECCFEQCCGGIATEAMCVGYAEGIEQGRRAERVKLAAFFQARADAQMKRGGGVSSVLSWASAAQIVADGEHINAAQSDGENSK